MTSGQVADVTYSYAPAEAAKAANCSIQQFWDRLYRARKQLKKLLRAARVGKVAAEFLCGNRTLALNSSWWGLRQ